MFFVKGGELNVIVSPNRNENGILRTFQSTYD